MKAMECGNMPKATRTGTRLWAMFTCEHGEDHGTASKALRSRRPLAQKPYEDFPQDFTLHASKVVGRDYLTARCQQKIDLEMVRFKCSNNRYVDTRNILNIHRMLSF